MKTEHSSLLADTGLSEIELDRMGLMLVRRMDIETGDIDLSSGDACLHQFVGRRWHQDEDIQNNIDLLRKIR